MCLQEKGNNNAQWWQNMLLKSLGSHRQWFRVGLRQLSGMLIVVFAVGTLQVRVGTANVALHCAVT